MQAWEEAKDSGELDSDSDGSDDEDELTRQRVTAGPGSACAISPRGRGPDGAIWPT